MASSWKRIFIATAMIALVAPIAAIAQVALQVSNPVLSIRINEAWGGAIDSVKVLGYEVVDVNDTGRQIQASLYFNTAQLGTFCGKSAPQWYNSVQAGDLCNNRSSIYAIGSDSKNLHVGTYPLDWHGRGQKPAGLLVEGHHEIGPLSYLNRNEVARLSYRFINNTGATLNFQPNSPPVADGNGPTPVPYIPHAYFKNSELTRLFGLTDSGIWVEETSGVYAAVVEGDYRPTRYKYKAMAWMRENMGWGVALYSRNTLNQPTNFVAAKFPTGGTNALVVTDQSITTLANNAYIDKSMHMVVGSLATIKEIVDLLYAGGY